MRYVRFSTQSEIKKGILISDTEISCDNKIYPLKEVKLLAPCVPKKVIAIGLNYADHAREMKMELPEEPTVFLKANSSVIGPEESIVYPKMSSQVDYEAELAIVIKDRIKNVSAEEAEQHILGYTCANDVTARDLQKKDGQWIRAKSFDTFCPLGPWIETELDTSNLKIQLLLNGEVKQSSSTKELIFSPSAIVSFLSQIMTLEAEDVILTGTPSGIGPMQRGDKVEVAIEGIGVLCNNIK